MRRGVQLFIVVTVLLLTFAVYQVWTLITLLFVHGYKDAIPKSELPPTDSRQITQPQLIPKIIHQTYNNESIPPVWQEAQQSCVDLHKPGDGWEYKLWTDDKMLAFVKKEYPWFAETFEGYPYPIMRADAIRYFVLDHFGGVYIDLDDGCNRPLEPLLHYPAWVRKTIPTGVSNDAMGAHPGHPFFKRVIKDLKSYNRNWILPYITVMGSTGPLFLSVMWRRYTMDGLNVGDGADGGRIRILFPKEYMNNPWSFFTHHLGNSWHGADVELIFWMARNWVLLTVVGLTMIGGLLILMWWFYRRFILVKKASESDVPTWKKASIRSRFPFWRRRSAQKEYELVSRHEV